MKADRCVKCRNWVYLRRAEESQRGIEFPKYRACRFGEKPSTCVEFSRRECDR